MAERIRVLWLIRGLGPGGAERLLLEAARVADHRAFDIDVVYLAPEKDALVAQMAEEGLTVTCLGEREGIDWRWVLRLRRHLRSRPADVVHAHSPVAATVARLVARTLPARERPAVVSTEHNLWAAFARPTRVANALTLPLADHHFAVSDEVRTSMSRRGRDRTEVLVHGIEQEGLRARRGDPAATRRELGVADDDVVVMTVANFRATKDHPNVLQAARLAFDAVPNLRWFVVGQGPLEGEIRRLHGELGLGDRLTVLGQRDDVPRLLGAADLLVLGSRHEGLPVTVMESFALGVPVIATAVGGLRSAVHDGEDGLLVPPGRPDLLADAVTRVAGDPELRRTLAEGATRAAEAFDASRAQRRVEAVYRELSTRASTDCQTAAQRGGGSPEGSTGVRGRQNGRPA